MSALDINNLLIEQKPLHVPALSEIAEGKLNTPTFSSEIILIYCSFRQFVRFILVLSVGLKENFREVSVSEVDCPDLTAAPYHLAGHGLCGSPTIVEVGGPPYLLPTVDRTKLYDLVAIGRKVLPRATEFIVVGAGAGPHPHINSNCEVNRIF